MGSLTKVLSALADQFHSGITILTPYALNLVLTLAVIDIVLTHIRQLEDGNHIHLLTWNVIKYSFFYYTVANYDYIVMTIINSFIFVGLKAGGSGLTVSQFADPSMVIKLGSWLAVPFIQSQGEVSTLGSSINMAEQINRAFNEGAIELSFIIMAIQLFVVFLEFYIISALAIMLLPFGANSHTKFLYDKVVPAIVGSGVKLMFMAFILSVAIPLLFERKLQLMVYLTENPNIPLSSEQAMESLGVSMAVAFLCWQAPTMAAGLMSGMGAGLSASSLSQTTTGMNDMSKSIASSGGGAGVGKMMQGISAAMAKATDNVLPDSDNKKKEDA